MKEKLKVLILRLSAIQCNNHLGKEIEEEILLLLADMGFESDEDVPEWLITLLTALVEQKPEGPIKFNPAEPNKGDYLNLFAELETIIPFYRNHTGEYMQMQFDKLEMQCFISFEGDVFEVSGL